MEKGRDEINRLEEHHFNLISREVELQKPITEWKRLTDTLVKAKDLLQDNGSEFIFRDLDRWADEQK